MTQSELRFCVFGLGEAGGLIGADLVQAGVSICGYDPKPVPTPAGLERYDDPIEAVKDSDIVIALTAAADATGALQQAFDKIPHEALYADFSTASAGLKQTLASRCASRDIAFADVAIMSIVPGNGIRAPTLVAGSGAQRFVEIFTRFGMPSSMVSLQAGDAATRKLVRSVMMKGLAAVVIESLQAAEAAGCTDWLWRDIADEINRADESTLCRLVKGTHKHGLRRLHEMEASTELLQELGVEPIMTSSTSENLRRVVQEWPDPNDDSDSRPLPHWWHKI